MSGFEVAGLVLGVLPMAIQVIGGYRTILSSVKSARRDLTWLERDLETERTRLQNTCECLLVGIAPLSVIDSMIDDPFGPDWKKFNDPLRLRLWRSWGSFQRQVALMSDAVSELKEKLAMDATGKTSLMDKINILRELKQSTVFTLKKGDYEALLSKIKSANTILHGLVQQNDVLEPNRRRRSQARVIKLLRMLSQSIYNAIRSTVTCACANTHVIGLELIARNAILTPTDEDHEAARKFQFHVVMNSEGRPICWNRLRIQPEEFPQIPAPIPTPSAPASPQAEINSKKVKWFSAMNFGPSRQNQSSHQSATQTFVKFSGILSVLSAGPSKQPQSLPIISNMCQIFRGKGKTLSPETCYGYISDEEKHRFALHPPPEAEPSYYGTRLTLRNILAGDIARPGGELPSFNYPERLKLAFSVSSSILHIYKTPWLPKIITLDDIVFLLGNNDDPYSLQSDTPYRPFVTQGVFSSGQIAHPAANAAALQPLNMTILSVGAILLHIITGNIVEHLDITDSMDMNAALEWRDVASRLEAEVTQNGGMKYASAVRWCFDNAFGLAGFEHDQFCQNFYEAVVKRLEGDVMLLQEL